MSSIYGNIVALQPLDWWLEVIRIQLLLDISAAMIYKQCMMLLKEFASARFPVYSTF